MECYSLFRAGSLTIDVREMVGKCGLDASGSG